MHTDKWNDKILRVARMHTHTHTTHVRTHLPDVLLQQSMDDDPDKGIEDHIEEIQQAMLVESQWQRSVVQTSAVAIYTK